MGLTGNNTEEKIWNYLIGKGLNTYGTAGLMGNLYAESALNPQNLQNSYEKSLGYTDETYTIAVDSDVYKNFVKDSAGYGLAQWTYCSRKQNILDFARAAGKSIGDLEMQLDFLYKELSESYKTVLSVLKTATSVKVASDNVLVNFECPADQSDVAKIKRASYGQAYYDKYAGTPRSTQTGVNNMSFIMRTTKPEAGNKYYIRKASGGYSPAIKGSPTDADCDVLSNCVGYAIGRFNEIGNWGECKYLSSVNAENFIQYKNSGLEVSQTPQLGACAVWQKGATLSGSDGAGHVAIVEKVVSDTEIITSESGYGSSKPFWTQTRKKGSDGNWGAGAGYKFLGFILNPAPCCKSSGGASSGNTPGDASENTGGDYKVGDVVKFTGNKHYTSSNAASGVTTKPGSAKITAISAGAKHPYHVIHTDSASNVYGWVDLADIGVPQVSGVATTTKMHTVVKGDTLSAISSKYGTTVAKIVAANKSKYPSITANYIVVGWVLTIA